MMSNAQDNTKLEAAIDRALSQPPETLIAAGFAARVRAALPPPALRRGPVNVGRRAAFAFAAALLLAVFLIAPHTVPSFSSLAFDGEMLLLVELACIAVWLANPRREV